MPAPTSPVDVCNIALDHIGQLPISSIVPPVTSPEQTMARHYDKVRRMCLREYTWNFARTRTNIDRTGTPEIDYADAYTLPNDCLRVLSVNEGWEEYDIDGRDLVLNASGATSIKLRYTKDVTEVGLWDSGFLDFMSLRLAEEVAYKFTLKKSVSEELTRKITLATPKAISVKGQERPPRRIQNSKYLRARMGYGSCNPQYIDIP